MAITPADIEQKTFSEAKKNGYNTEEVDEFLDQLSAEVDAMLKKIMVNLYHNIDDAAKKYGFDGNFVVGANIAGFEKVMEAMMAQGIV